MYQTRLWLRESARNLQELRFGEIIASYKVGEQLTQIVRPLITIIFSNYGIKRWAIHIFMMNVVSGNKRQKWFTYILNPWMIRQAHAEEREVFVWFGVVEHPVIMRFLLALGADGLMVDDPVALAEVLGR